MTGPAIGKIHLKDAKTYLVKGLKVIKLNASVYIHLKGYALATVTHLDIEHESLNFEGKGNFIDIYGIKNGIEINLRHNDIKSIIIKHNLLNRVLKIGEKTHTWVGFKLENLAKTLRPDLFWI